MAELLFMIPLFPLLGFLINSLAGRYLTGRQSGILASFAVLGSFLFSLQLLLTLLALPVEERLFTQTLFSWIPVGQLNIEVSYLFDPLTAIMTLVVSGVGLLIHIYSIGYMEGDAGIRRYFSFLNLFTFMMLNLVLADNLVLMFLGWEGVGLCSYLLIGFWFEDESKARAGMKAFIVNRIGDVGFIIAMVLLYYQFGTLNIEEIAARAPTTHVGRSFFTIVTLAMFLGATGKSAQIPLYVWLPDAMAGPTPVSALIHAATMVTAGVYLIARNSVLFSLAPATMSTVAIIGVLTAFFAATIAVSQNDIKKVLAYSTISQLGYMFTAVGMGAFAAGIFHLMTHSFFKSLLFLGAGSIIHSLKGEQDLDRMGGLKGFLPTTHWTMLIGVLAIAGIPGMSGFFSKDEILWAAFDQYEGFSWLWFTGVVTAGLTALYMFRLFFRTFYGPTLWQGSHQPHEAPSVMTIPLVLLAFLSIFGGYIGVPTALGGVNRFHHFLEPVFAPYRAAEVTALQPTPGLELIIMTVSTVVVLGGVYYAYRLYLQQPAMTDELARRMGILYRLSYHKYFIDEFYHLFVVRPFRAFAGILWNWLDAQIVDGVVNGCGHVVVRISSFIRRMQNGLIPYYASIILLGVIFIMIYLYID